MSILDELRELVIEHLGLDKSTQVTLESSFIKDLGADSLDLVELILALEERYKVAIPDEDAQKIVTVKDALDYLKAKGISVD